MARLECGDYTFIGESVAGTGTVMVVKELKLCFDLGTLVPAALATTNVFISHGHTDHCGELFNYLGIRALEQRGLATLYVAPDLAHHIKELLDRWQQMSNSVFDYRIVQCFPGAPLPLKNNIAVTAFPLAHSPPTSGFLVEETVQKLMPQYNTLPAYEIINRKKEGEENLFYKLVRPLLAFLPDTLPEGLDEAPEAVWKARVLALEATFLDDRKPMAKVRAGRHLHLDDIIARLDRFEGEYLLLFHFSKIYTEEEIRTIVFSRVPSSYHDRIRLFL
jgi:ribonuclease Z